MADVCKSFAPTSLAANEEPMISSSSGLPSQFINSMKTLFNILDDAGVGLVPLSEIERRWRDDAVPNLPGVLDSLRTVAPPNGMLTFEVFVWGLRTALRRARQQRGKSNIASNNNFTANGVASQPHSQRNRNDEQNSAFNAASSNDFRPYSRNDLRYNEALRSGVYPPQQTNWIEKNDATFGRYQLSSQQDGGDGSYYQGKDSRGVNARHRRSNSGSISTATVHPTTWNNNFANTAEVKYPKMGFATKFSAQESKSNSSFDKNINCLKSTEDSQSDCSSEKHILSKVKSGTPDDVRPSGYTNRTDASDSSPEPKIPFVNKIKTTEIVSEKTSQRVKLNDFDAVTTKRFLVNETSNAKSAVESCRYIGFTGSMRRTKLPATTACHYGSLRRPAMSVTTENSISASESCFSGFANTDRRRAKRNPRNRHKVETHRRQYASAGESGDESHHHIFMTNQNPIIKAKLSFESASLKGGSIDCRESDFSPQESMKSSSNSSSPVLKENYNGLSKDQEKDSESDLVTSDDVSHDEKSEPRQLLQPPPPGRSGRLYDGCLSHVGAGLHSSDNVIPHYATLGRRRSNSSKRRAPRRHTVANGIDYNLLKCIRQVDEDKEMIVQTIEQLNESRKWFQNRLFEIEEKRKVITDAGMTSDEVEDHETELLQTKRQLLHLVEKFSEMSNAVTVPPNNKPEDGKLEDTNASCLKEQNNVLLKELSIKSEMIKKLEREKSLLVQQLFNAKAVAQMEKGQANTSIFI